MAIKHATDQRTSLALYRKYRPSSFEEVRGQETIVTVLQAAVEQKKVAHAYLFSGSRGTGKTSMARILAHAVGTTEKDIYEMDAASNRGIDEIRELREGVSTLPFESIYKFYILDEVHALTPAAWGALLKTLEEPPSHVVFILATTEIEKVPETIISRCQVYQFKKPSHEILKKLSIDVAKEEHVQLPPESAELIALMADGSFRDTLGILQKVLTISSDKLLSEGEVAAVVGAPSSSTVNNFLEAIDNKNLSQALSIFHKAVENGIEPKVFSLLVISKVRNVLLARFAPEFSVELKKQFSETDMTFIASMASKKVSAINSLLLVELITAHLAIDRAPIPAIPLELALYKVFQD